MEKNLSQIVADLFLNSKKGEDLSSKILQLRDEIKKVIENEDAIFGKFRGLLESFREIIPDEKQRYHAAIKALSTTSKLSWQEIVKAVNSHLEELKILEKSLMPALPGRDELKVMEARSKEIKDEIAKLREKAALLEKEEEEIRRGMAAREKEMELVEKTIRELFTDLGTEITHIKKKVEEFTVETAAVQPIPQKDPLKSDIPGKKKGGGDQKVEIQESPAPVDTEFQRKCPMCGGRINFHALEKMWICYSCAYEEPDKGEEGGDQKNEIRVSSAPQDKERQKRCPICGGRMDFVISERMWQCYSCAYQEDEEDEVPGKREATPPFAVPLADMSSSEYQPPKKKSSSTKTKPCPSCRKKMFWFPDENAWRCPSCHYETRNLN